MMNTDLGMLYPHPPKYRRTTNKREMSVTALRSPRKSRNPTWCQYSRNIPQRQKTMRRTGTSRGNVATNCHVLSESSSKSNRSAYAVKYANANKMTCVATLTHGRRRATRSARSLLNELVAITLYLYRDSPRQTSDRIGSASSLLAPCQATQTRNGAHPNRSLGGSPSPRNAVT